MDRVNLDQHCIDKAQLWFGKAGVSKEYDEIIFDPQFWTSDDFITSSCILQQLWAEKLGLA